MPISFYTPQQMEMCRRINERVHSLRRRPLARGEIEFVRSVHPKVYHNAVLMNGGVDDSGKTCWDDPEFCSDMDRRHPEITVRNERDVIRIGPLVRQGAGGKVRTRLGIASFHKSYG